MDILEIGCTPLAEPAAQVGQPDYTEQSRLECMAFRHQLTRQFPQLQDNADCYLVTRTNPHDFGSYREVAVKYAPRNPRAQDLAYLIEASTPEHWDAQAAAWLRAHGYRHLPAPVPGPWPADLRS